MTNMLNIDGRKTSIILPSTRVPIVLNAEYRERQFDLSNLTGQFNEDDSGVLILHFSPSDGQISRGSLNHILVCTAGYKVGDVICRATGVSRYKNGFGEIDFYQMGDDLEIKLTDSAKEAVLALPKEIRRAALTLETMEVDPSFFTRLN